MRPEPFGGLLSSSDCLVALGADGHTKGFHWPHKDALHSHLDFLIAGLIVQGVPLWLDPTRDALQMTFDPSAGILKCHWHLTTALAFDINVTKTIHFANNHTLIESYTLDLPAHFGETDLALWFLMAPQISCQKRFQCVHSQPLKGWSFAFLADTCIGMSGFACHQKPLESGIVTLLSAQWGDSSIGQLLERLVLTPENFREIEMGHVVAFGRTAPLPIKPIEQDTAMAEMPEKSGKHSDGRLIARYHLCIAAGQSPAEVVGAFATLALSNPEKLAPPRDKVAAEQAQEQRNSRAGNRGGLPAATPESLRRAHLRATSLAVLRGLTDSSGALMAAPEMDEDFHNSGGYGFMWPRDAAFCALALLKSGHFDVAAPIVRYLARVQEPDGEFYQRYTATGQWAPGWCPLQADQVGLTCVAFCEYLAVQHDDLIAAALTKGLYKLVSDFEFAGHLKVGFDLWEETTGYHFYAFVCAYGALSRGRFLVPKALASRCEGALQTCLSFCSTYFHPNQCIARNVNPGFAEDGRQDVSSLACLFPLDEYPLSFEAKKRLFLMCVDALSTRRGVQRYEGDTYAGGNPWTLATFWVAGAAATLAKTDLSFEATAHHFFARALTHATPAGFFAEQIDDQTGKPAWVLPLAWSHAMFLWTDCLISQKT